MDDATVEIVLRFREENAPAIAEARAGLDMVRHAVEKFAQAQTDGMTATFAMREALKKFRDMSVEAGLTTEAQKVAVNQARDAMLTYNAAIAGGLPEMAALSAALGVVTGEFEVETAAVDRAKRKWTEFAGLNVAGSLLGGIAGRYAGGLSAFGALNPFSSLPTAIAEMGAALSPFVAALAGAIVVMTAFSVGATGMALALGGAIGMFLTIGGAILLLDDKLGFINKSMGHLKTHLKDVGDHLAKLAAPAANQIVKFIDSLLPLAQSFGSGIIEWFSARLPLALTSMHSAINSLAPDLRAFGSFLGAMFDKLSPQIVPMFEEIARFGIGALQGLISNLVDLGQWFQTRLPSYLPVISQMFGGLGSGIQSLATNFGKLSDWFVGQWPNIQKNLDAFKSGFGDAFDKLNKTFGGPGSVDWTGFFHTLGEAVGGAAAVIGDMGRVVGIVFSQVVAALPAALQTIADNWTSFVRSVIVQINNLITAYNALPWFLGGGSKLGQISLPSVAGHGGAVVPSGRAGGTQTGVPPAPTQSTLKITLGPGLVAQQVSRNLQKIGAV